ncbi:MAG: DNA polymerase III subunit delta [Patescibacteria group bacterium]|nr:DNA polymerase III subunit delta [Patescibacteria group bacterium]
MLYLISGNNEYQVSQETKQLISKHPDYQVEYISGNNITDPGAIFQSYHTEDLFGSKRFIIIQNFLTENKSTERKKELAILLEKDKRPEENILVFQEYGTPTKNIKLTKYLIKSAENILCEELKGVSLQKWIIEYVEKQDGTITKEAAKELISKQGNSQLLLKHSLDTLLCYDPSNISIENINLLTPNSYEDHVFQMIGYLLQKNITKYVQTVSDLKHLQTSEFQIIGALQYKLRNLMTMKLMKEDNIPQSMWAKQGSIPPFEINMNQKLVEQTSISDLKELYQKIIDIEYSLKSSERDGYTELSNLII